MEKDIRVLIADDHTLFRDGLLALLNSVDDIKVIGTAQDGLEAVNQAADSQPDVILMDILMPELNGIEATRKIILTSPHVGVIMLTMFEDDESVFSAMRAGARGYILKGAGQDDVLRAIRAVDRGEALFGPSIATRLMDFFKTPETEPPQAFPELTERENEILALIAQGASNHEIAEQLNISLKTVRNHVSNIYNKMQVTDRVQAVLRAREAGLGMDGQKD
ncbi:MAG: response regulator transcription factor [Anaerolineales bacterium]|nr:response regulator transcription factor [Anaerolineales bacterium]